jgi:hypothetical protein
MTMTKRKGDGDAAVAETPSGNVPTNTDLESLLQHAQNTADGNVAVVETPQPKINPRPSERERAYNAIDSERDYQDRKWGAEFLTAVEALLHIKGYLDQGIGQVSHTSGDDSHAIATEFLRKIGALAVKGLEIYAPHREGYER